MSSYTDRMRRRELEESYKELRDQGLLGEVKGISPEMDRRIKNTARRVARKEAKS